MYSEDSEILADFSIVKKNQERIFEVLKDNFLLSDKALKILHCGDFLGFQTEQDSTKVVSANFCRERLCPMCQKRKSLRMFAEVIKLVENLQDYDFLHLVLTVPNCGGGEKLVKTVKELYTAFNKFKNYKPVKKAFKGILRCLEISYSDRGDFHPHLHCLIAVNKSYFTSRYYLSYDRLRELWAKANRTNVLYQISVGKIKGDIAKGVAEVCKYCVKPLDLFELDNATLEYVYNTYGIVLKGQRAIQKYGVIKTAWQRLGCDEHIEKEPQAIDPCGEVRYYFYRNGNYKRFKGVG